MKLNQCLQYLGTKWILHPDNQVKRGNLTDRQKLDQIKRAAFESNFHPGVVCIPAGVFEELTK